MPVAGAPKGALWLDIGCGAGTYTRMLASEGLRVIGIDYSLPSLVKACKTHRRPAIDWFAADVNRLPVKNAAVDRVLCFRVLQAVADSGTALQSIARTLKPQGSLWSISSMPNALPTCSSSVACSGPASLPTFATSIVKTCLRRCAAPASPR